MPGLKRSATRRVKYGGSRSAEMELRDAIDFFFQLCGADYRKLHPKFSVPASEEFFTYARAVNSALEKTNVKKIRTGAPKQTHRKLPVVKLCGRSDLDSFLRFTVQPQVFGSSACDSLLLCCDVLLHAVVVYKFTTLIVHVQALYPGSSWDVVVKHVKSIVHEREFAQSFTDPMNWFCEQVMPLLHPRRDQFTGLLSSVVARFSDFVLDLLHHTESLASTSAPLVGNAVIHALRLFFTNPLTFDSLVALPLSCVLAYTGLRACTEKCRELMTQLGKGIIG